MDILDLLNERQLEAVQNTEGFVRVIAGAGSGKTRALATRYAYIVEGLGISTSNILCVTFTNKAAREMRSRVQHLIARSADLSFITTYHGFCVRVLKEDINKIYYPKSFLIMDNEDKKSILRDIYKELNLTYKDYDFKEVLRFISKRKTSLGYLQDILESKDAQSDDIWDKIFTRYIEKQQRNYALDFDDLINFTLYIFKNHQDVLEKWQDRMHYIQVDEMQDSSPKQFSLVEMLSRLHKNLFVVGDPDQTIYEWRGAKPEILVDFDEKFPGSSTVIMDQNYRSTPNILNLGNEVIRYNKIRVSKDMFTVETSGTKPVYFHGQNEYEEGMWIADEIKRLTREENWHYSDITILYRASHISRIIEQSLMRQGIPYTVYGGIRFFERKEIKDVLSYLRLIEFGDDLSFLRIINTPSRGLGKKFLSRLKSIAERENLSLYAALEKHISKKIFNRKGAIEFLRLIKKFRRLKDKLNVSDLTKSILDESGLSRLYRTDGDTDRLDNIKELLSFMILVEAHDEEKVNLAEFMQEISLYTDMDVDEDKHDRVKLMTIHTSKGLEFPIVFISGFTEGVIPSARSIKERRGRAIEEERRLTYVAITRAEKRLYITESEGYNFSIGQNKLPSRFLLEMPSQDLDFRGRLRKETIDILKGEIMRKSNEPVIQTEFMVGELVLHPIWKQGKIIAKSEERSEYQIEFNNPNIIRPIAFEFRGLTKVDLALIK